jgi:hypothetical protein
MQRALAGLTIDYVGMPTQSTGIPLEAEILRV